MRQQDLAPLLLVLLCAGLPAQAQEIFVRDHGAIPDDGLDDLAGIRTAAALLTSGDKLVFEAGTYDLYPSPSLGDPAPANQWPTKHMITLQNLEGITVDGFGATLLLHEFDPSRAINGSYYDLFWIESCSDFEIRDLTVNMLRPSFSTGVCTAINGYPALVADRYFEMLQDPVYPGDPPTASWKIHEVSHFNPLYLPSGTHYRPNGRVFMYFQTTPIDPAGPEFSFTSPYRVQGRTTPPWFGGYWMMKNLANASQDPGKLKVGDLVVLTHQWDYYVCFQLWNCSDPILSNLTIHAFAGMGVNINYCSNPTVDGLTIIPNPPERLVSATADGLHVSQCSGNLLVTNCHIEGTTDNAVDIYNGLQKVGCVADGGKIVYVDNKKSYVNRAGDLYEFYDSSLVIGASQHAQNVSTNVTFCPQSGQTDAISFLNPTGLSAGDFVCNLSLYPTQVDISACTVVANFGDGFNLRRNVDLTGCTVIESTGGAVSVFSERGWFNQGPGPMNVTVTNLVSNETSRGFHFTWYNPGVVNVSGLMVDTQNWTWTRSPLGAAKDVFVLHGILEKSGGCAVSVSSCDQMVIDFCHFDNVNLHTDWLTPGFDFEAKSLIFLTRSDNVLISNNTRAGYWLGNGVRTKPPMLGYQEINNSGW